MMTVMCPNCRQLFGARGCCEPGKRRPHRQPPATTPASSQPLLLVDGLTIADDKSRQHQVTISTQCGVGPGGCLLFERLDGERDENEAEDEHDVSGGSDGNEPVHAAPRDESAGGLELLLELRCQRGYGGAGAGGCCLVLKQPDDYSATPPASPEPGCSPRLGLSAPPSLFHPSSSSAAGAATTLVLEPVTGLSSPCEASATAAPIDDNPSPAQPQRSSHSTTARLDTAGSLEPLLLPSPGLQHVGLGHHQSPQCGCCRCRCRCCCSPCCCLTYCRSSRGSGCGGSSSLGHQHQHRHHHLDEQLQPRAKPEGPKRNSGVISSSTAGGDCGGELFEIQLNAGLRLLAPLSLSRSGGGGGCTFSFASTSEEGPDTTTTITTTTISTGNSAPSANRNDSIKPLNIFHGGGLVVEQQQEQEDPEQEQEDLPEEYRQQRVPAAVGSSSGSSSSTSSSASSSRNNSGPGTPLSWLMAPCPWQQLQQLDATAAGLLYERDLAKLAEARRRLQHSGWYHEGLSWQQSEALLKNASLGTWLMRDSSDRRYTFAISVQTSRGPTSVRVLYLMGKFRLDAEPHLASSMPLFDCPIRMVEYYREYSNRQSSGQLRGQQLQEVWVDYNNQVYSQIYLAEPLLKEVASLSHLARIAINRNAAALGEQSQALPPLIRDFLDEYPYAF